LIGGRQDHISRHPLFLDAPQAPLQKISLQSLLASNKAVPLTKDGDGWCCGIHKTHFPGDDQEARFAIVPGPLILTEE